MEIAVFMKESSMEVEQQILIIKNNILWKIKHIWH